jgi:hypothetical protein
LGRHKQFFFSPTAVLCRHMKLKKAFNGDSVFLEKLIVANAFSQSHRFIAVYIRTCGPGSLAGKVTGYGLDGPGNESRGGRDFPHLSRPALGPPSLLYNRYRVFPGVKSGRSVMLTPQPLLVPWSRKGRAIPLLYGSYGLYRDSVPVQGCTLPICLHKNVPGSLNSMEKIPF